MRCSPFLFVFSAALHAQPVATPPRDYPVKPVPFTAVHVNDGFWAPRIETNRTVTIPFAFGRTRRPGAWTTSSARPRPSAASRSKTRSPPGYPFDDTDVYKVIEGAAYALSVHPDPKLDAYVDGLIAEDRRGAGEGRLPLHRTHHRSAASASVGGKERWELEGVDSHELYNLGHLYEAAAAHYHATGKRSLLDIALRTANLL